MTFFQIRSDWCSMVRYDTISFHIISCYVQWYQIIWYYISWHYMIQCSIRLNQFGLYCLYYAVTYYITFKLSYHVLLYHVIIKLDCVVSCYAAHRAILYAVILCYTTLQHLMRFGVEVYRDVLQGGLCYVMLHWIRRYDAALYSLRLYCIGTRSQRKSA